MRPTFETGRLKNYFKQDTKGRRMGWITSYNFAIFERKKMPQFNCHSESSGSCYS